MMAMKLDEHGRPDEAGKRHAEDVILAGRALHVIGKVAKPIPKPMSSWTIDDLFRHKLGIGAAIGNPYLDRQENW
jgi:hypothetical protein